MKFLGETFDIHTGGIDHIPIHHTNEIAQSECATGQKFVNYWMHSEFIVMNEEEKMSKSLGNVLTLDTLKEKGILPLAYRYFCLNTHYRKKLGYSEKTLEFAQTTYENLIKKFNEIKENSNIENESIENISEKSTEYLMEFKESIFNDLNTPKCLGILWNVIKDNKIIDLDKYILLKDFDKVLGLDLDNSKIKKVEKNIPDEIIKLAEERKKYREEKNWEKSDELRDKIKTFGFEIKDTKDGFEINLLNKD
jgi:cysteinyl-tRNA synthetase